MKKTKLLTSMLIVIALTATAFTQLLPVAAIDVSTGPTILLTGNTYDGPAPPFDYEGELEDYTGVMTDATWIDYDTIINVSALGATDGVSRLLYRVWNFAQGWMIDPYGGYATAAGDYEEFTMGDWGRSHPCWHKIEAYYENTATEESVHTNMWVYLDPTAPTTTNYTNGCYYYAGPTYPIPTEQFTGSIPGTWTHEGSWGYDAGNGGCVYNPTPAGLEQVWSPLVTGIGGGTYTLTFTLWSDNAGNTLDFGWDEDTANGGFTSLQSFTMTTGSTFTPVGPFAIPESSIGAAGNDFYLSFEVPGANPGGIAIDDVNLTYQAGGYSLCLNYNSTVYLNATDGLWNIEDASCPSGVNFTEYRITGSGDDTGWVLYDGMVNLSLLENDCMHTLEYNSTDFMGNEEATQYMDFYFDNTPPIILDYTLDADYTEDVNANYPDRQPLLKFKNVTEGCVNISVLIDSGVDCCPSEESTVYLLVTRPDPSKDDPEARVDIMVEMTQIGSTNAYYFNWCNDDVIDIRCMNLMTDNTLNPGRYDIEIIVEDCIGNNVTIEDYFLIKPLCDADIIELLEPAPFDEDGNPMWHPEMPREVKVVVKNNGILPIEGPLNTHLQIYEETDVPLKDLYCFDMESCIVSGMWEAYSWDEGPAYDTWTWTEQRSNSPTHSWHTQPDSIEFYEGHSRDSLILANGSQGFFIPEECEYEGQTYSVFLNFSHWVEGEAYDGVAVDYGMVSMRYYDPGLQAGFYTNDYLDWAYGYDSDWHVDNEQYFTLSGLDQITGMEVKNASTGIYETVPNFMDYIIAINGDEVILSYDLFTPGNYPEGYIVWFYYDAWSDWEFINLDQDDFTTETPYYDTGGAWEDVGLEITNISGRNIIGKTVQFNWTWYADYTDNREGWYIDDVCIRIQCGSPQPLVFQGYKYVYDLDQNETQIISYPINFTPKPDTWYFFEIYTDLQCCDVDGECQGDYDGPADKEGEFLEDERTEFEYWDPDNGVNHSLYFGDVCDAAILSIETDQIEYILDHTDFEPVVPVKIFVDVKNTGTLTKDVPVIVKVQEKLTNTIFIDDAEGGVLEGWGEPGLWVAPEALYEEQWTITDEDYYSPTHSWFLEPRDEAIGQGKMWGPVESPQDIQGGLKWEANIKWNMPTPADGEWDLYGAVPVILADAYYWDMGISIDTNYETDDDPDYTVDRVNPWQGESGWFHFDADEFIRTHDMYWEERYNPTNYPEYEAYFNESGGFDSLDQWIDFLKHRYQDEQGTEDFSEVTFGFLVEQPDGLEDDMGFWFDDYTLYSEYPGTTIWEDTKVAHGAKESDDTYDGLDQFEVEQLNFTWNATEYCDYIITAEVDLDCDIDPSNDMEQTSVRIHEEIFLLDEYDHITFEDNTCEGDDLWILSEECSLCPDDTFWYCGNIDTNLYNPNMDDSLYINRTFDLSAATMAWIEFNSYYAIEQGFDFAWVEITNDSGMHWFSLGQFSDHYSSVPSDHEWVDTLITLEEGTTILSSSYQENQFVPGLAYTDFVMPNTFFTDEMQIRFRFTSDALTEWKGWYIDDVLVDAIIGGYTVLFEDDMEDYITGAMDRELEANWTHAATCMGNGWHNETDFGDGTTAPWWWNGEPLYWPVLGANQILAYDDFSDWSYDGTTATFPDGVEFTDLAGDGVIQFRGDVPGITWFMGDGGKGNEENKYMNFTDLYLPDVTPLTMTWAYFYFDHETSIEALPYYTSQLLSDRGPGIWVQVLNETGVYDVDWTDYYYGMSGTGQIYCPEGTVPATRLWGYLLFFDLDPWKGQEITISIHVNSTIGDDNGQYLMASNGGGISLTAYLPGATSVPYRQYNPNRDEKVIYEFDLTHAIQAILHFDQNFSFFDENDLGYVEISTDDGATWKTILVNRGSSGGWLPVALDISAYAGGDIPILVRWRFVSNETGTDYGWMFDNIWIDGKVDYTDPMITATLNPADPDGTFDWYTSDVTVTLTATDNLKVDHIKYRIDGGSWLTYTAPFSIGIDGEHTIEYYPVDSVGNEGDIGSVSFKIDKTAPTGSINAPQAGYIYLFGRELMPRILFKTNALIIGGLNAEASASDSTSGVYVVKFNEDGTTFAEDTTSPYAAPLPFSLFGTHELTVTVIDQAGNTYTTSAVPYFKVF